MNLDSDPQLLNLQVLQTSLNNYGSLEKKQNLSLKLVKERHGVAFMYVLENILANLFPILKNTHLDVTLQPNNKDVSGKKLQDVKLSKMQNIQEDRLKLKKLLRLMNLLKAQTAMKSTMM